MGVLPPGILTYKRRTLHTSLTSQLKSNTVSKQCCSPSDHTTHCAALYTAHCSSDTQTAMILGVVTSKLTNATTYDCVTRAGRKDRRSRSRSCRSRLKIKIDAELSRSSIQTIQVKIDLCEGDLDLDLQHCYTAESLKEAKMNFDACSPEEHSFLVNIANSE